MNPSYVFNQSAVAADAATQAHLYYSSVFHSMLNMAYFLLAVQLAIMALELLMKYKPLLNIRAYHKGLVMARDILLLGFLGFFITIGVSI